MRRRGRRKGEEEGGERGAGGRGEKEGRRRQSRWRGARQISVQNCTPQAPGFTGAQTCVMPQNTT